MAEIPLRDGLLTIPEEILESDDEEFPPLSEAILNYDRIGKSSIKILTKVPYAPLNAEEYVRQSRSVWTPWV